MGGDEVEHDCDVAPFCITLTGENRRLREQNAALVETLMEAVDQSCLMENGELDSLALSTWAGALDLLAELGKVTIVNRSGRRIIARWVRSV